MQCSMHERKAPLKCNIPYELGASGLLRRIDRRSLLSGFPIFILKLAKKKIEEEFDVDDGIAAGVFMARKELRNNEL